MIAGLFVIVGCKEDVDGPSGGGEEEMISFVEYDNRVVKMDANGEIPRWLTWLRFPDIMTTAKLEPAPEFFCVDGGKQVYFYDIDKRSEKYEGDVFLPEDYDLISGDADNVYTYKWLTLTWTTNYSKLTAQPNDSNSPRSIFFIYRPFVVTGYFNYKYNNFVEIRQDGNMSDN